MFVKLSKRSFEHLMNDHFNPIIDHLDQVAANETPLDIDMVMNELIKSHHEMEHLVEAATSVRRLKTIRDRQIPMAIIDMADFVDDMENLNQEEFKEAIGEALAQKLSGRPGPSPVDDLPGQYI